MHWFIGTFDKSQAFELLEEIEQFTNDFVLQTKQKLSWPFRAAEHGQFTPKGAVIHASYTRTVGGALELYSTHTRAHFLVCSTKFSDVKPRGNLLSRFPVTILAPFTRKRKIAHSGWMSSESFGIELRNVGRLRPFTPGKEPPPLLPQEMSYERFHESTTFGAEPSLYSLSNSWRSPWVGPPINSNGGYFEQLGRNQLISLVGLLRVLSLAYGSIQEKFIMPSHVVSGGPPHFQALDWDYLRKLTETEEGAESILGINQIEAWDNFIDWAWGGAKPRVENTCDEFSDIQDTQPYEINPFIGWRAEKDMGQLRAISRKRELKLDKYIGKQLASYGYDVRDHQRVLQHHAVVHNMLDATDDALAAHLVTTLTRNGFAGKK